MSPAVSINLLPEKARRGEVITMYTALGIVLVALVAGAAFMWTLQKRSYLGQVNAKIAAVDKKLNSPELKKIVAEVEAFVRAQKQLKDQSEILVKLRGRQAALVQVLDLLPDILPAKASLKTMETEKKGSSKTSTKIKLVVFALDREVIPQFYENLANRSEVKNVNVVKVAERTTLLAGDPGHEFEITFEVSNS